MTDQDKDQGKRPEAEQGETPANDKARRGPTDQALDRIIQKLGEKKQEPE
jgi:hypothetical protein